MEDEIEAIRARHEAHEPKWQMVGNWGVQAHADRATLLRALDEERARVAELSRLLDTVADLVKRQTMQINGIADRMATLAKETKP